MNTSLRSIALFVATLFLLTPFAALAQDPPPEEKKEETKTEEPKAEAGKLTDEQNDYVAVSATVACYNKRVTDTTKANAAIEGFLESEGMTLDEYKALEKNFRGDTAVQEAIKQEMELCDTKVLAMPEEGDKDEELTDEEKKALEEAAKKREWTYAKKVYKSGTISSDGVSKGRITVAFKTAKKAKGNFGGRFEGQAFSIGISGTRDGNKITLSGTSGKTNSAKVTLTFNKKTSKMKDKVTNEEYDYEHYSDADGKFSGKINGKSVSFSFSAESKKK